MVPGYLGMCLVSVSYNYNSYHYILHFYYFKSFWCISLNLVHATLVFASTIHCRTLAGILVRDNVNKFLERLSDPSITIQLIYNDMES